MKKIISLILVLIMALTCFVACGGNGGEGGNEGGGEQGGSSEKTYKLSIAVDDGFGKASRGGVTAIAVALVLDANDTIVAIRFDSVQPTFALNETNDDVVAVQRVDTKVELGDDYAGMSKSWKDEAAAFETFVTGKTLAQVAAYQFVVDGEDAKIVSGCTMVNSMPVFQSLIAKAGSYDRKVSFTTDKAITLGLAIDAKVSGSVAAGGKISADFAAVAVVDGKVAAAMLDSAEAKYAIEIKDGTDKKGNPTKSVNLTLSEYKGTKNEQGENYDADNVMKQGDWYVQAQKFADFTVGKAVAGLADTDISNVSGCTIYAGGYLAVIVRAAGYAR